MARADVVTERKTVAHIICLSDLHLGDAGCVFTKTPSAAAALVDYLAQVSQNAIETLVLNGDIWEQCIPMHDGHNPQRGFFPSVASASEQLFGALLAKIDVKRIVWVPGNHDFTLFKRLAHARNMSLPYTSPRGVRLTVQDNQATKDFFEVLLPPAAQACEFRFAFPNYATDVEFPYILFHHGHLFDPFVLGWNDDAKSRALYLLGLGKPVDRDVASMLTLAKATESFVLNMWSEDSQLGYVYWNYLNRRLDSSQSCPLLGAKSQAIPDSLDPSSPRDGFLPLVPWYLNIALTDPELPTPVGSFHRSTSIPDDFTTPSCFVFGHDHLGSRTTNTICGVPFAVRDSAGWTVEHTGHHPHTHFLLWNTPDNCIPESHFVRL